MLLADLETFYKKLKVVLHYSSLHLTMICPVPMPVLTTMYESLSRSRMSLLSVSEPLQSSAWTY